jgi:hypothetical protein
MRHPLPALDAVSSLHPLFPSLCAACERALQFTTCYCSTSAQSARACDPW